MPHTRLAAVALATTAVLAASLVAAPGSAGAEQAPAVVGSPDGPDPYFPKDGNGGYEVTHYTIDDRYDPAPTRSAGVRRSRRWPATRRCRRSTSTCG